jgi:hypothetical protein
MVLQVISFKKSCEELNKLMPFRLKLIPLLQKLFQLCNFIALIFIDCLQFFDLLLRDKEFHLQLFNLNLRYNLGLMFLTHGAILIRIPMRRLPLCLLVLLELNSTGIELFLHLGILIEEVIALLLDLLQLVLQGAVLLTHIYKLTLH